MSCCDFRPLKRTLQLTPFFLPSRYVTALGSLACMTTELLPPAYPELHAGEIAEAITSGAWTPGNGDPPVAYTRRESQSKGHEA